MASGLEIKNLSVLRNSSVIIHSLNLEIGAGETHILTGVNGSGKSTLALALAGHPHLDVKADSLSFAKTNLLSLAPHERVQAGILVSSQQPVAIPGLKLISALRASYEAVHSKLTTSHFGGTRLFLKHVKELARSVGLAEDLLERGYYDDFSGGERRRGELLTALVLQPKLLVLDELDSGIDTQSFAQLAAAIKSLSHATILLVSHNPTFWKKLHPHQIWEMQAGTIKESHAKSN